MSDLFGEGVSDEYIAAVFGVMAACPQHTFQVLTKRAERMRAWFDWIAERTSCWMPVEINLSGFARMVLSKIGRELPPVLYPPLVLPRWPLPNVHLGVSVEDRAHLHRLDELRAIPAAVHWTSLEPLLDSLGTIDLHGIDWVVVGGESGDGARPCDLSWIRSIVEQCRAADVPVFVKQLGARPFDSLAAWKMLDGREPSNQEHAYSLGAVKLRDRKGGDPAEWSEDLRVREWPRVEARR